MKKNSIHSIALALMASAMPLATQAQTLAGGKVKVTNKEVKKVGNNVNVNMGLNLDDLELKSNKGLIIVPMIVNGEDTVKMPAAEILGRNRYIYYERNGKTATKNPLSVTKRNNGEAQTVDYSYSVPYKSWMQGSQLVIAQDKCGCSNVLADENLLTNAGDALLGPWKATYAYVQPQAEAVKARQESGAARLKFVVGKSEIKQELGNNASELSKIKNTIDLVKNDKDVTITGITLHGYASPDGKYASNEKLAANRTKALYLYLKGLYPVQDKLFKTGSTAEDWDGVKEYIANNDFVEKDKVSEIVNSAAQPDQKEQQLAKNAPQGYKYLLQNVFPDLRRTEYTVSYDVRSFNLEEAREVLKTRPQKLSLNEMYIVANSYEKGSDEFNNVFDTAVKMFPNDKLANLNAAQVALDRKDVKTAAKYLAKAGDSAEAENARGILAVQQGDNTAAKAHFEKAAATGLQAAKANLAELEKRM